MKTLITLIFFTVYTVNAQELYFEEITFPNEPHPILFDTYQNIDEKYPVNNLFDGNFKTCWIAAKGEQYSDVWIKLPDKEGIKLNIFSGYGKSTALYYQNARPQKIHVSLYYGFLPDGYVSESSMKYKIADLHKVFDIELKDKFGIQTFSIPVKVEELNYLEQKAIKAYKMKNYPTPINQGFFIALSIDEIYKGTKYDDVCISEMFFNRPYIVEKTANTPKITNVFIKNDNTLIMDTKNKQNILVYQDKNSILQLLETDKNKEWAILLKSPDENTGRIETEYLLIDLINKKLVNNDLKTKYKDYYPDSDIYFEQVNDQLFLKYFTQNDLYSFIELTHKEK